MKERLKKIKALFADVDNTLLCIHMQDMNGNRTIGFSDYNEWLKFNIFTHAYADCTAPRGMFNLVNALKENGARIYGLTECSNSFEYNSKYMRLRDCYPDTFHHHMDLISIDARQKKCLIMQYIAERDGLSHDEIMFVDDSYSEVMQAFSQGFFAMHTTEAMERFPEVFSLLDTEN